MRNFFIKGSLHSTNQEKINVLASKQQILFASDIARSVLHFYEEKYPEDKRPRLAIEAAENYVLKNISAAANAAANATAAAASAAYNAAWAATDAAAWAASSASSSAARTAATAATAADAAWADAWHAAAHAAASAAASAASTAINAASIDPTKWDWLYDLYQSALPRPIPKSPDLINIAKAIIETRNFSDMLILADALEEAGTTEEIVNQVRNGVWGLSNWVIFSLGVDNA